MDNISEFELHKELKKSKEEFIAMQEQYKKNPSRQLKFDISLKYLEVKLVQSKISKSRHK